MPYPVSRVDDLDSSDGVIVSGSPNVFCNGIPVATVGDVVNGLLGQYAIIDGAATVFVNGKPKACVTSITSVDTEIVTGSPNVFVE